MKGIIKSLRKDKTACQIEGKWYYFKEQALIMAKEDDLYGYEVDYVLENNSDDRIIYYVKRDKKVYPKQQINQRVEKAKADVDWDGKDRRMVRMNCLTQANKYLETNLSNIKSEDIESFIFDFAEKCENWIYRNNTQGSGGQPLFTKTDSDDKPNIVAASNEGGGSSPLSPSFSNPQSEQEHEDWLTYKALKGDDYKVKALWVDFAKGIGYSDAAVLRIWEEKNAASN